MVKFDQHFQLGWHRHLVFSVIFSLDRNIGVWWSNLCWDFPCFCWTRAGKQNITTYVSFFKKNISVNFTGRASLVQNSKLTVFHLSSFSSWLITTIFVPDFCLQESPSQGRHDQSSVYIWRTTPKGVDEAKCWRHWDTWKGPGMPVFFGGWGGEGCEWKSEVSCEVCQKTSKLCCLCSLSVFILVDL